MQACFQALGKVGKDTAMSVGCVGGRGERLLKELGETEQRIQVAGDSKL